MKNDTTPEMEVYKRKSEEARQKLDDLYDEKRKIEAAINKTGEELRNYMDMLNNIQCSRRTSFFIAPTKES